jgi:hypothetical protein
MIVSIKFTYALNRNSTEFPSLLHLSLLPVLKIKHNCGKYRPLCFSGLPVLLQININLILWIMCDLDCR